MRVPTRISYKRDVKGGPILAPSTTRVQASAKKTISTVKKGFEKGIDMINEAEKYRECLANEPIETILKLCYKGAEGMKNPVGAIGRNPLPVTARTASISNAAEGGITSSMSMYVYRPPRKHSDARDTIKYSLKTKSTNTMATSANLQNAWDVPILAMEPVSGNPSTDSKYSNLTVREAFDNYLLSKMKDQDDSYDAKVQQTSIHVTSLTSELVLTNNLTTDVMMDLYELVPQHQLGPTSYDSGSKNYAVGYMSPLWTFANGLTTNDTIMAKNNLAYTDLSANPYNSTLFSRTWKQVKKVRINLASKAVHRHKSVYAINKTVSYQEMAQYSTSGGMHSGWNPVYMVVQRGVPGLVGSDTQLAKESSVTYLSTMQLNYEANADAQAKVIVFDNTN